MKQSQFCGKKYQKGFDLAQLALVLVIAGLITAFALPKYLEYRQDTLAEQEVSDITTYMAKIQNHWSGDADYATLANDVVRTNGLLPDAMIQGTNVVNRYGGAVTFAPTTIGATANDAGQVTSVNYSLGGCQRVVPKLARNARSVTVNGNANVKPLDQPMNKTELGNACTDANTNTVVWTFNK